MNKVLYLVILKQLPVRIFVTSFSTSLKNFVCLSSNAQVFTGFINVDFPSVFKQKYSDSSRK